MKSFLWIVTKSVLRIGESIIEGITDTVELLEHSNVIKKKEKQPLNKKTSKRQLSIFIYRVERIIYGVSIALCLILIIGLIIGLYTSGIKSNNEHQIQYAALDKKYIIGKMNRFSCYLSKVPQLFQYVFFGYVMFHIICCKFFGNRREKGGNLSIFKDVLCIVTIMAAGFQIFRIATCSVTKKSLTLPMSNAFFWLDIISGCCMLLKGVEFLNFSLSSTIPGILLTAVIPIIIIGGINLIPFLNKVLGRDQRFILGAGINLVLMEFMAATKNFSDDIARNCLCENCASCIIRIFFGVLYWIVFIGTSIFINGHSMIAKGPGIALLEARKL